MKRILLFQPAEISSDIVGNSLCSVMDCNKQSLNIAQKRIKNYEYQVT